jgi:hypothetical protein
MKGTQFLEHARQAIVQTFKKKKNWAGHQCLTPVILATQETEIRRIVVLQFEASPGK